MRSVFILAWKDLKIVVRDRVGAFFYFVFPVLYAILVGYMMSGIVGIGVGMYSGSVSLAVVDEDQSEASAEFLKSLQDAKELKIQPADLEAAKEMVRQRRCVAYLVLQKGFESDIWQLLAGGQPQMRLVTDSARPAEGQIVRGMVYMQLIHHIRAHDMHNLLGDPQLNARLRAMFRAYLDADTQMDPVLRKRLTDLLGGWERVEETLLTSGSRSPSSPTMPTESDRFKDSSLLREIFPITFPQGMIWAMIFSAAFFAISLVEERTEGTLQRLRMAPLTRLQLLLGKGVACLVTGLGVSLALLTLGILFFYIRPDSYVLLFVALFCAALCFSGMMMLFASLGKTPAAASGISLAALLIMAMLGGAMVPEIIMPPVAKAISEYVPVKWAIMAIEGPIRRDFSFGEMAPLYAKLTILGMACYIAGVYVFRRTIE